MYADNAMTKRRALTPIFFVKSSIKPIANAGSAHQQIVNRNKPFSIEKKPYKKIELKTRDRNILKPPTLGTG